jgi:uncharacterized protein YecE (DUF72 family)
MQTSLFSELPSPAAASADAHDAATRRRVTQPRGDAQHVAPQPPSPENLALAERLPSEIHLGTSSWGFPGWSGLVWDRDYTQAQLARQGLPAYARHPLLRTVSLDRAFYRPLSASEYALLAAQVPDDFRFVVKAPSLVTDALVRGDNGRGMNANPRFLAPESAVRDFVQPAIEGLGAKIGALVFQLSPLPGPLLLRQAELLERLRLMLRALPSLGPTAPHGVVAVELRNDTLICPELADALRDTGATYCLGLHAKMPPIEAQLPLLRALWPGPLVCRWNLHRRHGAYGYEDAKDLYAPFDRLVDPDLETRAALARVAAATARARHPVYVTINNKAEGSAPLSVQALAQAIAPGP